jgi:benzaldehyde dehydrogenase (NAD)
VETHAAEISSWIVRESGSIPPKGDFEIGLTIREALEVASLAGAPIGQMLSTKVSGWASRSVDGSSRRWEERSK